MTTTAAAGQYAHVNGIELYYEIHGAASRSCCCTAGSWRA